MIKGYLIDPYAPRNDGTAALGNITIQTFENADIAEMMPPSPQHTGSILPPNDFMYQQFLPIIPPRVWRLDTWTTTLSARGLVLGVTEDWKLTDVHIPLESLAARVIFYSPQQADGFHRRLARLNSVVEQEGIEDEAEIQHLLAYNEKLAVYDPTYVYSSDHVAWKEGTRKEKEIEDGLTSRAAVALYNGAMEDKFGVNAHHYFVGEDAIRRHVRH